MSQYPEGRPHLCLMVAHEVRELIKRQYEKALRGNAPGDEAAAISDVIKWMRDIGNADGPDAQAVNDLLRAVVTTVIAQAWLERVEDPSDSRGRR